METSRGFVGAGSPSSCDRRLPCRRRSHSRCDRRGGPNVQVDFNRLVRSRLATVFSPSHVILEVSLVATLPPSSCYLILSYCIPLLYLS